MERSGKTSNKSIIDPEVSKEDLEDAFYRIHKDGYRSEELDELMEDCDLFKDDINLWIRGKRKSKFRLLIFKRFVL